MGIFLMRRGRLLNKDWAASLPEALNDWPAAKLRSYNAIPIRIGKDVSLMRKTLTEWSARGDRTQLAGFSMTNASRLNGG